MLTSLFKKANEALAARYSTSLIVSLILSVLALSQQYYIQTRAEVVIQQPMFSLDREMKYVRGDMTKSVSMVWAFNAVQLFSNVNEHSVALMEAIAYSFIDSEIAARLKLAHKKKLANMKEQSVTVSFTPDGKIEYDDKTEWVTITGTRTISPTDQTSGVLNKKSRYMYKVKMAMTNFRPWVSDWKEGLINE
jgi:hypothetical protein